MSTTAKKIGANDSRPAVIDWRARGREPAATVVERVDADRVDERRHHEEAHERRDRRLDGEGDVS